MSITIRKIVKFAKKNKKTGQGMVEFALILPVLLVSLFVIIELARVLHAWLAIENGARTGVRFAVTGEYDPANCNGGFSGLECSSSSDEPEARVESIHAASWAGSTSIVRVAEAQVTSIDPSFFKVIVCDPDTVIGPLSTFGETSCPGGEDPGDPGDRVVVVVEFNHPVILPGLSSLWPQLRLTATREATVETFRVQTNEGAPPTVVAPPAPTVNTPPPTVTELPKPECSNIQKVTWKFKSARYYVVFQDHNEEDGFITNFTTTFPNLGGGYLDEMEYKPDANNTEWNFDITTGNFSSSPFSISDPAPNDYWVSPTNKRSRVSVNFGGVPGGQLTVGTYTLSLHIEYPGFAVECDVSWSRNVGSVPTAGPTGGGGSGGTDEPTPPFPETNTPPPGGPTNTPGSVGD